MGLQPRRVSDLIRWIWNFYNHFLARFSSNDKVTLSRHVFNDYVMIVTAVLNVVPKDKTIEVAATREKHPALGSLCQPLSKTNILLAL